MPGVAGVIVTVSTTGAVLDALTVQVNVSLSLALPSLTDTVTLCAPTAPARERAADDAGRRVDRDARGQPGGAVGQRVAVGVARVRVEAHGLALGVCLVREVGGEGRRGVERPSPELEVTGALVALTSATVARTRIRSPLSPLPAVERSSVELVAPAMSVPLRDHW